MSGKAFTRIKTDLANMDRRRFLITGGTLALAAFAGCSGGDGTSDTTDRNDSETDGEDDGSDTGTDGANDGSNTETDGDEEESTTGTNGEDDDSDTGTDGEDDGSDEEEVTPPEAVFQFDYTASAEELEIAHAGGEGIAADQLNITGSSVPSALDGETWAALSDNLAAGDSIFAGETILVENIPGDAVLELIWVSADGSQENVLSEWQGPDA
jgi:hypothetical protein